MIRRSTWRFFLENAGYATPPGRAVCALELARGEQWAERNGIEFRLEDDLDADASFVDTWPLKEQREWKKRDHSCCRMVCYRPCPDHGWDCRHKEVLASLGGIFDPTDDYLRVVRAELALEAMPDVLTLAGVRRPL
jgi:hypothetical protein